MSRTSTVAGASQPVQGALPAISRNTLILFGALMLGETTINYIDRQVVSVLNPVLTAEFNLTNAQYAMIINAFLLTYAVAYSFAGWALDKLGIRRGLTVAITWWSTAGVLTAFSRGPLSMSAFRSVLAIGEAGAWPSFAKAAATWIPVEARSLFIGACNSGSSLGAMIAVPLVAGITQIAGWRAAFAATGLIGFVWVGAFQIFMRRHPEFSEAKQAGVAAESRRSWLELLTYRQTWAVFSCRFLADPFWYFFLVWIPAFLSKERGLSLVGIGIVGWIPYLFADASNFISGYVALRMQRAGWSVNRTRKTLMAFSALLSPIGILAVFADSLFWTIALISAALFFWIFWSVAVHTLAGDYFPSREVGSVYGFAGTGSTLSTVIVTWAVGYYLDISNNNYVPVFVAIGLMMPLALIIGGSLMGRVEPVKE